MSNTCQDCIHFDVCEEKWAQRFILTQGDKAYMHGVDERCKHFKDKSRMVELPCEIGATIYQISRGQIIPMVVNSISFNAWSDYMLNCNYEDEEMYGYSLLTFTEKTRGYYWGLKKEEAENALAKNHQK